MQKELLQWYDTVKRDLPWRHTKDPYAIWVSEIMLQQTRAETVIGYWTRFMARYPAIQALALAPEEEVLKAWEGLGYYSRARNLLLCARKVCDEYNGQLPCELPALRKLPGIGEYTAGAVASIAFGIRTSAVDGNVERVVSRLCGIREDVGIPSVRRLLRARADTLVPEERPGDFNQAMMELGASVCQPGPRCDQCPVYADCDAYDAGDADMLPIKQRKTPQKILPRGIALVFYGDRVLMHRREERLLQGMWCFPGFDKLITLDEVGDSLNKLGINVCYVGNAGNARHVFTHIIWEMTLLRFTALDDTCPNEWRWVDRGELLSLPVPTAMKTAKAYVEKVMGGLVE